VEYQSWQLLTRQSGLAGLQSAVHDREQRARTIRSFQLALVPGLLQTEDYARAVLKQVGGSQSATEQAVHARLARQSVLNDSRKQFRVPDRGSRAAQSLGLMRHNEAASGEAPRTGGSPPHQDWNPTCHYRPTLWNSFVAYDRRAVHLETLTAELVLNEPGSVSAYVRTFDRLVRNALTGTTCRRFLASLLKTDR